jgi:hypothetical protein
MKMNNYAEKGNRQIGNRQRAIRVGEACYRQSFKIQLASYMF